MNNTLRLATTSALSLAGAFWAIGAQAAHFDSFTLDYNDGSQTFNHTISTTTGYAYATVAASVSNMSGYDHVAVLFEPGQSSCTTSYSGGNFSLGDCSDAFLFNINGAGTSVDMYLVSGLATQTQLNDFYTAVLATGDGTYGLDNYQAEETGTVQALPGLVDHFNPGAAANLAGSTVQSTTSVPEPESLALLIAGWAGMAVVRRRKAVAVH